MSKLKQLEFKGWTVFIDEEHDGMVYAVSDNTGREHQLEMLVKKRRCIAHGDEAQVLLERGNEENKAAGVRFRDDSYSGCSKGTLHAYIVENSWVVLDCTADYITNQMYELIDLGLLDYHEAATTVLRAMVEAGEVRARGAIHNIPNGPPLGSVV